MAQITKTHLDSANFYMDHNIHLATRTLYIGAEDEIDGDVAERVIKGLGILASISSTEPINIILNNNGGDVEQGFAIYDFIKSLSAPVRVYVYGVCYSMAAALLQAGDERYLAPHSHLMIHDGTANVGGYNRDTTRAWGEHVKRLDKWYEDTLLVAIQSKYPEFTRKRLQHWLAKDTIFTAERAVELGLADKIIGGE